MPLVQRQVPRQHAILRILCRRICYAERMLESTDTEGNFKIRVFLRCYVASLGKWLSTFRQKSIAVLFRVKLPLWTEEFNFVKVAMTASHLADGYLSSYLAIRLASRFIGRKAFEEVTWRNNVRNPLDSRFRCPCGLKSRSTDAWLMGLRVRMPLSVWRFVWCDSCVMFI